MNHNQNIWVVIPAAGVGRRMDSDIPKQYLTLNNKTVIEHTINIFDTNEYVSEIVVAVSKDDTFWPELELNNIKPLHKVDGGTERCHSVMNALKFLQSKAQANDWVLVHDAARPCLRAADLTLLLGQLSGDNVGGILAIPVRDTMKRAGKASADKRVLIEKTVDRAGLWHALTPQMFRYEILFTAMERALAQGKQITDEASAVEFAGYQPVMVEGHADNIKITQPDDLVLAEFYLQQQEKII